MNLEELQEEINKCLDAENESNSRRYELEKELKKYKKQLLTKFYGKYIKLDLDLASYGGFLYFYLSSKYSIDEMLYEEELSINGIEVYEGEEMKLYFEEDNRVFINDLIYAEEISKDELMKQVDKYSEYCKKEIKQLKENLLING